MPEAWSNLIDGLTLLSQHATSTTSPLNCDHDVLFVLADPEKFTADELSRLSNWGFIVNEEFGGFLSYRYGSA